MARVLVAYALSYALTIAAWFLIGRTALDGRLDRGWLVAWALLLGTQVVLTAAMTWWQSNLAIDVGALLKQRLLAGALQLSTESVRTKGAGELLGRVLESEAVEALAVGAGYTTVMSVVEIAAASIVLALGAAPVLETLLLVAWVVLALGLARAHYVRRRAWTTARIGLTNDLVERMVGHRTRLAQQARDRWHEREDETVVDYVGRATKMDSLNAVVTALLPRGWFLVGIVGLAAAFVGAGASQAELATTLGGLLLAMRALHRFVLGTLGAADAAIAWRQIGPLFHAASDVEPAVPPDVALSAERRRGQTTAARAGAPIIEAREVVFRYRAAGEPVLRGCSMIVRGGDRVLLEGRSGGGKSTLASLLCGLREPEAGLILVHSLDRKTLGLDGWRRRVVATPQFHENHVMSATLAFNILMGCVWPPPVEDLLRASEICAELGLDEVLARMPSGPNQMVGETGWQLSHGERSRVYIARSLLQDADVLLFDESFAALDPDTLERALTCVMKRARALIVIAHP